MSSLIGRRGSLRSERAGIDEPDRALRTALDPSIGEEAAVPKGAKLTRDEVHAFVGWTADFYLDRWALWSVKLGVQGRATGFNWAAFLFTWAWLS